MQFVLPLIILLINLPYLMKYEFNFVKIRRKEALPERAFNRPIHTFFNKADVKQPFNVIKSIEDLLYMKKENETEREFFWSNKKSKNEIRQLQKESMEKYLNPKIDPCTDFYEYACGNWKNYYTVPADRASYDTFEIIRENLDYALRDLLHSTNEENIITSKLYGNDPCPNYPYETNESSDATLKAKNLYKSCMQQAVIEERGVEPLIRVLDHFGGWPVIAPRWNEDTFHLTNLLAKLRLFNNDALFAQWIGPDMKNSNEFIIHIDQTALILPEIDFYLQDSNIVYMKAYRVFILAIVSFLTPIDGQVEKDVDDMIEFEKELAKIMAPPDERRNLSEYYIRTDIAALSLYFPQYDWHNYFKIVLKDNFDINIPVACYCGKYLHHLVYLLTITPPRVIQNYCLWRFVRHRINNMDGRFAEAKQRFYNILFGREQEPSRWQFCVNQVNSNMGMALGALFVRKYFSKTSRSDTIEMTERLEEAFRDTLLENSWLDNHTKEYARMKINKIDLKIGYPDFILNPTDLANRYRDVHIHPKCFLENVLSVQRHLSRAEQKRIGTEVNRTVWSTPPAVVNAYYSRNKNQIMFPAGMLQPPFYHRHFPKALNFGGIGVVIGHEITHGFDDKGRLFDHLGNLHLWWRESSMKKFSDKCKCFIDQYSKFVLPEVDVPLNGYLTQGENIADNGGLKQSFRAYERWLKHNQNADETLPDFNFTNRQLFFLNFAQVWCGQQRLEAAKRRMKSSVHAPGIFRVLGVLSNSEEFSKAFNCPRNSPMNPDLKCTIW